MPAVLKVVYAPPPTTVTLSIRLSICLSVCPILLAQQRCIFGLCYYRTLIGNRMLEAKLIGLHGQLGNKAIAGAASEALARWLHHRYAFVELIDIPRAGSMSFRRAIPRCIRGTLLAECSA